jgi:hypothetical protein
MMAATVTLGRHRSGFAEMAREGIAVKNQAGRARDGVARAEMHQVAGLSII